LPETAKLKVIEGPRTGETFEIRIGQPLVIGRSPGVAVCIDVPGLSREHFELRWDGTQCVIADLKSRNGLFLNGDRISEATVRGSDRIEAGQAVFQLEIGPTRRRIVEEPQSGDSADSAADSRPHTSSHGRTRLSPISVYDNVVPTLVGQTPSIEDGTALSVLLRTCAVKPPARVFALVDGAKAFELAFEGRLMGNRLYTLFTGALAVQLAHVGPCLVELSAVAPFLQKWIDGLGNSAGVLFRTEADLVTLYGHLRHLFVATDERGREYFFRFYDPRVLRVFLPTCTEDELLEFFGPIQEWVVEQADGTGVVRYAVARGRLQATNVRLPAASSAVATT
jgi:pSer/pThr/pTyr-binding forkhead associated (FHA) protein